jgi:hypothetical protein
MANIKALPNLCGKFMMYILLLHDSSRCLLAQVAGQPEGAFNGRAHEHFHPCLRSEAPKVAHESMADQDAGLEHSAAGDNWNGVVRPAGPFQKRGRQVSEVPGRAGA